MHPSIPSGYHNNRVLSAEEIYSWATKEMYMYCRVNELPWVWGYMWNRWYCPPQCKLWARAAGVEIPRIRTTMIVESLWRTVKRKYLIDFNKPRLDLALYLILKNCLPGVSLSLQHHRGTFRPGRADVTANWQKDFRREWLDMGQTDEERRAARLRDPAALIPTSIQLFNGVQPARWLTNLEDWTCSCPAYSLSRLLMCKHLVRLANARLNDSPKTDLVFFTRLRRYHQAPYYRIRGIHAALVDPGRSVCRSSTGR
jgi:hypothetical protein